MSDENRNIYKGHRYVPLIDGEWDNSKSYEGLTIVTYQGTSYTSKKYVPVGVDINNNEYWVVTGNYNAQVEHYRKEVRDVKEELTKKANKNDLDFVSQELTKMTKDVLNLGTTKFIRGVE